jgi:hypothetical protein
LQIEKWISLDPYFFEGQRLKTSAGRKADFGWNKDYS